MLLRLGSKRLGVLPAEIRATIEAVTDRERLEAWIERLFEIEIWEELFTGPESP